MTVANATTASSPAPIHDAEGETLVHLDRRAQFLTLGAVMLGMLLGSLDQTIVGTAMPRIVADLNGLQRYTWVITGYLVASTTMMPIFGKVSDIFGRKWLYMLGIVVFLGGSMLSGIAQSMEQLIAFRVLQGAGAGMMLPIAQAIIGDIFTPAERGKYQGLLGAVFGLAIIIGPGLGGWITDNATWRWVFYVNVPFAIAALAVVFMVLPNETALHKRHSIDWAGSAALILAVVPLLLAISLGSTQPDNQSSFAWDSPQILGLFAMAAFFTISFIVIELRAAEPTVPLDLFANRMFTNSVVITFFSGMSMFLAILYIPLFVQDVLGRSATNSGVILTPMMLAAMPVSIISGQILSRTGHYRVLAIVGTACVAAGLYLFSTMTVATGNDELARDMVVMGLGLGTGMSLFTIVVQNAFPVERLGVVTSSLAFFRSIGGAVGVALLGSIMNTRFMDQFHAGLSALPAQLQSVVGGYSPTVLMNGSNQDLEAAFATAGPSGAQLAQQVESIRVNAFASGISEVFLVGAGLLGVAVVSSFFLKEIPLRESHGRTGGGGAADATGTPAGTSLEARAEAVPAAVPAASPEAAPQPLPAD
jgi:EmrB/QacA subfamily drug resistance transporter